MSNTMLKGLMAPMAALAMALLLAACSSAEPVKQPVNFPSATFVPGFSPELEAGQWWYLGPRGGMKPGGLAPGGGGLGLQLIEVERIPTMRAIAGVRPFIAVREADRPLGVTPFLAYSWKLIAPDLEPEEHHAVSLAIGFRDTNTPLVVSTVQSADPAKAGPALLPPHDRVLFLSFGPSALQRGTVTPVEGAPNRVHYTVRGGRENLSRWFTELLDLSDLHRAIWPEKTINTVRISFLGVSVEGDKQGHYGDFVGIDLTR
ncbi:MAG: hypothetical protein ACPGOV_13710 [Magnetovibrionaceae bacterium]